MSPIEFVCFCCFVEKFFKGKKEDAPRDVDYIPYLRASIAKHHPTSRLVIQTNKPDEFKDVTGVEIKPIDVDQDSLIYERARHYYEHVRDGTPEQLYCFIDPDCLLNGTVDDVAERDFDLALTYRNAPVELDDLGMSSESAVSPINTGVIFSRTTDAAIKVWQDILQRYEEFDAMGDDFFTGREHLRIYPNVNNRIPLTLKFWGGDQFALMSLFSRAIYPDFPDHITHGPSTVAFLDGDIYNYVPNLDGLQLKMTALEKRKIVHLKGQLKHYIAPMAKHMGVV